LSARDVPPLVPLVESHVFPYHAVGYPPDDLPAHAKVARETSKIYFFAMLHRQQNLDERPRKFEKVSLSRTAGTRVRLWLSEENPARHFKINAFMLIPRLTQNRPARNRVRTASRAIPFDAAPLTSCRQIMLIKHKEFTLTSGEQTQ